MNNAITYIDPYTNTRQHPEYYVTELHELTPISNDDEYYLLGTYHQESVPRRVMAKILSHLSRKNIYPSCKFIPITINWD